MPEPAQTYWKPKYNPWAIALTVTMATFMEVLDTSIANVALPHIAGTLSASQDESTWVLTSYLVSNAIILPISAWLATMFGRKRFYMTCVTLFTCSSFLCGLAPTLGMLIFFRILQGAGGGGLQPSEQAILADTFPPSMRGIAFAVYGMAVVIAPAIGPTLGGFITDNYSWRWIFYINVPIGILSLYLTNKLVEDPPYLHEQRRKNAAGIKIDYIGLGLIVTGIGCLQIVLDKGQEADWFATPWIAILSAVAVYTLVLWAVWEWHHPNPIVDIRLLRSRNLSTALFFTFILGTVLFGTTVLIPQFLQLILGYPAAKAGEALAGGGLAMMVMMPVAGLLVSRMDPRYMMMIGFSTTAWSLYYITTHLSTGMDFGTAAMLRTYQSIGLAFIFIPSNVLSFVGLPREKTNQVSSMNSFVRNIGGSIGISVISTMVTRGAQKNLQNLTLHAVPGNPAFDNLLSGLTQRMTQLQAYEEIYRIIQRQATTLAYIQVISALAIVVACLIPVPFIMKKPKVAKVDLAMH